MSNCGDWEFMLNGDTQEFRNNSSIISSDYFAVSGGVDHYLDCQNDDFRMTTVYCEGETSANAVWQIGYELVSLWNGASILSYKNYRKASIYKLLRNGREQDYVAPSGVVGLLGRPPLPASRIQADYIQARKTGSPSALIHLATENWDAYCILKYLDMEPGWTNYYKLMDTIESYARANNITLTYDSKERNAFGNTANNFTLAGFDSRHGVKEFAKSRRGFKELVKENKSETMTLDEAHGFITKLAKDYLRKAHLNSPIEV